METVKSLQMEPQLKNRYGDYLSSYLGASFNTQRLSNAYNVSANTLEQFQTLAILVYGAWLVMTTDYFTIGMVSRLPDVCQPLVWPRIAHGDRRV
jgi:ATP-binding cassette, subfamily B, bacterial HlyB/CyaB